MSQYLMKIIGIVLMAVVLVNLLPTGKTSVLIKNILRLCMYLSILTPAFNFFLSLEGNDKLSFGEIFTDYFSESVIVTDESYINYCSEKSIETAENIIEKKVLEEYGINVEINLQASVEISSSQIKIERGFLDGLSYTKAEVLREICRNLETEYSVPFEVLKGDDNEMEYS